MYYGNLKYRNLFKVFKTFSGCFMIFLSLPAVLCPICELNKAAGQLL